MRAAHHFGSIGGYTGEGSAGVVVSSLELRLYYNASRNLTTSAFISIITVVEAATNTVMPITATYSERMPRRCAFSFVPDRRASLDSTASGDTPGIMNGLYL